MVCGTVAMAQAPDTLWTRMYEQGNSAIAYCVQQTINGGYILAGGGTPYLPGSYLVKTDGHGETIWERALEVCGEPVVAQSMGAYYVLSTEDGGYVVLGACYVFYSPFDNYNSIALAKTDSMGNVLWERHYLAQGNARASGLQETSDGGFIISGCAWYSYFTQIEPPDCYVMKTDSLGSYQWSMLYGDSASEAAQFAQETEDGGYIITGYAEELLTETTDVLLIKVSGEGDILWTQTYGGIGFERGECVRQTVDGGYIIAGRTNSYGAGSYDVYVVRTDSTGDTLWTRAYGGTEDDFAESMTISSDGNYVLCGSTHSYGAGSYDMYLIKIDDNGDTIWTGVYGGNLADLGYSVIQTTEGGYALAGSVNSFASILVKTCPDQPGVGPQIYVSDNLLDFGAVPYGGQTQLPLTLYNFGDSTLTIYDVYTSNFDFTTNFEVEDSLIGSMIGLEISVSFAPSDTAIYNEALYVECNDETVAVELVGMTEGYVARDDQGFLRVPFGYRLNCPYPNPLNAATTIVYDVPVRGHVRMNIFDVLGRQVATLVDGVADPGSYSVRWDAEDLPSGIYFVRMEAAGFQKTQKVVVLK